MPLHYGMENLTTAVSQILLASFLTEIVVTKQVIMAVGSLSTQFVNLVSSKLTMFSQERFNFTLIRYFLMSDILGFLNM